MLSVLSQCSLWTVECVRVFLSLQVARGYPAAIAALSFYTQGGFQGLPTPRFSDLDL